MTTLSVNELAFEIRRSRRRKSMQITVDRGGELVLAVPEQCRTEVMEAFVKEKLVWVHSKIIEKERISSYPPPAPKEYVSGEGFDYLGKTYRLKLVDGLEVPVKQEGGSILMHRQAAKDGRQRMIEWYSGQARQWIPPRAARFIARVQAQRSQIIVRDLGFRWGSCGKGHKLYFHWKTILLPPPIIDYVIVHELVHLREPEHNKAFWSRLEQILPQWKEHKAWLAKSGRAVGV